MGFHLGINAGSNLMLGEQQVQSLRLGDRLVWQREAPWSPLTLNPYFWLDAQHTAGLVMQGNGVAEVVSRGSGRRAQRPNVAKQPQYDATGFFGQPTLMFDGLNSVMEIPEGDITEAMTVFAVAQRRGEGTRIRALIGHATTYFGMMSVGPPDDYEQLYGSGDGPGSYHQGGGYPHNPLLWSLRANSTLNGGLSDARSDGQQSMQPGEFHGAEFERAALRLGSWPEIYGPEHWCGPISEVIVFARSLTDAEIQQVEQYLAARWGIEDRLPA